MINNARNYDWATWMLGLLRAFLSGGAAAFMTLGGGALAGVTPGKMWTMVGINFVAMGLYRLGEFLTLHGAPDQTIVTTDTTNIQPAGEGVKVTKVTEQVTSTEPKL